MPLCPCLTCSALASTQGGIDPQDQVQSSLLPSRTHQEEALWVPTLRDASPSRPFVYLHLEA